MTLKVNTISPAEIKVVKNGITTSLNVYEYSTKGSDLGEATRSSVSSYTSTQLNNWVGLQNDTWGGITNASSLVADRYYYIRVLVSDTNKYGKFCVKFKSYSGQTITTENMGWGYDGEVIYSTPVWGKPFSLTISQGTGVASVTVNRTSSPNEHASTGALSNGATIYYGDELSVSATASTGYLLDDYTTSYTVSGDINMSISATSGYYTVSLDAIPNATAYVRTSSSNYSSSVTAKYDSTIYVQVKPNNCYVYTLNGINYTPSSPYTTSYTLNSTNFTLSSTTPAPSTDASNKPTAKKGIGGSVTAAYYKVTLTVTNGMVTQGATTIIQYGNAISYRAKGNSKYYYVNKTTGGYGDTGYTTTYTPTSSVLPADGGATSATAVAFTYNVGSCTAYKTYTLKTTVTGSCNWNTYVKSAHALGQTSFETRQISGTSYTVYETDVFYTFVYASSMGGHELTTWRCTNNNEYINAGKVLYLTVGGSGSNTYWTTTTSSTASTGLLYRAENGSSSSPITVNGNVVITYSEKALKYTYYSYNSNIYSSRINSGTTYVNIYDSSKVYTAPPRLAYYPASAIRINGCICLHNDSTNSEFADLPLTSTKKVTLKHAGITGKASMGNQGPSSGNSGINQRQWLSVSKKPGAYKFYIRIWGISIPS